MRKSITALAVTAALAVTGGAAWADDTATDTPRPGMPRVDVNTDPSERPAAYPADNTGKNQRDASGATVTADDQSNSKADLEITQAVRKAVTADDALSINAQNVKIITTGGIVTLRGPVKNEAEKSKVADKAKSVAGVSRVDNQLEVTAQ